MPLSSYAPSEYSSLLTQKSNRIEAQFSHFTPPEMTVFASPESHFRQRAEFRVWHENDDTYFVMFAPRDDGADQRIAGEKQTMAVHRIDTFPIASEAINATMTAMINAIKSNKLLRHKLFQANFLSTLSGEMLVTLIYHKTLDEQWEQAARDVGERLQIRLIGRSKKQKLVMSQDFVTEELSIADKRFSYQQVEGSFTQPNARINEQMITWAGHQAQAHITDHQKTDLLELYCGNGNFTIPLSQHYRRVLATEVSKTSVRSALHNIQENKRENIDILRMSSEEFTQAINKQRAFRRLAEMDLDAYNFSTILVDPPRAGLDEDTQNLVKQYQHIIYISCNPQTLELNLNNICRSHEIKAFALFDQFPYTQHIECGVFLSRR